MKRVIASFLSSEELRVVRESKHPGHLFLGGILDRALRGIFLIRGDERDLFVHFDWFTPNPRVKPDFDQFKVKDFGTTIAFGDYEASASSILYAHDPTYKTWSQNNQVDLLGVDSEIWQLG